MGDVACDMCGGWPACCCDDFDKYGYDESESGNARIEESRRGSSKVADRDRPTGEVLKDAGEAVLVLGMMIADDIKGLFKKIVS